MVDKVVDKKETLVLTRRQFLVGSGAVVVTALVFGVGACIRAPKTEPSNITTPVTDVIGAGVIKHDLVKCVGCGTCLQMCSTHNGGEPGPLLSRTELISDPFEHLYTFNSCQQCASPLCYFACPKKDVALCIDLTNGTRYTNEKECIACGKCITACIYTPSRRKMNTVKKVAINCDLCRERAEGPICVQFCPFGALQTVSRELR
mgnify:CR=1 FL=1